MAGYFSLEGLRAMAEGEIDWVNDDIRCLLVMPNSSLASASSTDYSAVTINDINTLAEFDGSNYTSGGVALTGKAISTVTSPGPRMKFTADSAAFGAIDPDGTHARVMGAAIYKFNASVLNSKFLGYTGVSLALDPNVDTVNFNINVSGTDPTLDFIGPKITSVSGVFSNYKYAAGDQIIITGQTSGQVNTYPQLHPITGKVSASEISLNASNTPPGVHFGVSSGQTTTFPYYADGGAFTLNFSTDGVFYIPYA